MNQHQITVTRGDERTLAIVLDDDYAGEDAQFVVDGLFDKTVIVDEDPGSGYSTATIDLLAADTEGAPDVRKAYRYALSVGDLTVRRGLFVILPDLSEVA